MPEFTGKEDHRIALAIAAEMTKRYRTSIQASDLRSEFFGKETLLRMLSQADCVGIRCLLGRKSDGSLALILVGTRSDQSDIVEGELAEVGLPCPPICNAPNILNSDVL